MPITLTPFDDDPMCEGHEWVVTDIDLLANYIAKVALGQARHVKKIILGTPSNISKPPITDKGEALKLLQATNEQQVYHRDGWMFQVMSWIAAWKASPDGIIKAPQMVRAHKGFDGLQISIDARNNLVTAAIIFEDKATDNPRSYVQNNVWKEFAKLEGGYRENVLSSEVASLLSTQHVIDVDQAIESIIWKKIRGYRVSVTIGPEHVGASGRAGLFANFENIAPGPKGRRLAQTIEIAHLRPWMDDLASRSISQLQSFP